MIQLHRKIHRPRARIHFMNPQLRHHSNPRPLPSNAVPARTVPDHRPPRRPPQAWAATSTAPPPPEHRLPAPSRASPARTAPAPRLARPASEPWHERVEDMPIGLDRPKSKMAVPFIMVSVSGRLPARLTAASSGPMHDAPAAPPRPSRRRPRDHAVSQPLPQCRALVRPSQCRAASLQCRAALLINAFQYRLNSSNEHTNCTCTRLTVAEVLETIRKKSE